LKLFNFPKNDFDFIFFEQAKSIKINGIDANAIFNKDFTKITTITPIKTGDIIEYNNKKYLITSENIEKKYDTYYKANIEYCNYAIKFKINDEIIEFPAIIDSKTFDIQSNQYIVLPVGKIIVKIQENSNSENIVLSHRFIKMGHAWRVTGIDKTKKGLIVLHCDLDQIDPNIDDVANEVANGLTPAPAPEPVPARQMYISGADTLDTWTNQTYTVKYSDDNSVVTDKTFTFTLSNNNASIISKTSNSVTLQYKASGTVTLTATCNEDSSIVLTKSITCSGSLW
jgi:signal peptidase I